MFGVLYVAIGESYIKEACLSLKSLRSKMPLVKSAIFCDQKDSLPRDFFDYTEEIELPAYSFLDRIKCLLKSPFSETLYLDSDTTIIKPLDELNVILENVDLAVTQAPWRLSENKKPDLLNQAFPEPSAGVILYRKTKEVEDLFKDWLDIYRNNYGESSGFRNDQGAFRKALIDSGIKFWVLPCEYNLRIIYPYFAGGSASVKIIHGRSPYLKKIIRQINKRLVPRIGKPLIIQSLYKKIIRRAKRLN